MGDNITEEFHLETGHIDAKVGIVMKGRYITHRDSRRHFYRLGLGYAISVSILKDLEKKNVKTIRIIEHVADGESNVYECLLQRYLEMPSFTWNVYDRQKCLPLAAMRKLTFKEVLDV